VHAVDRPTVHVWVCVCYSLRRRTVVCLTRLDCRQNASWRSLRWRPMQQYNQVS